MNNDWYNRFIGAYQKLDPKTYEDHVATLHGGSLETYLDGIRALLDMDSFDPQESILEVCCGTGLGTRELMKRPHRQLVAIDKTAHFVEYAKDRVEFQLFQFRGQPIPYFEVIDVRDFHLPLRHSRYEKFDKMILFNAATEVLELGGINIFEIGERVLQPNGKIMFNIKIKDERTTAYTGIWDTLARYHNMYGYPENTRNAEGWRDAMIVTPESTTAAIHERIRKEGYRIKQSIERSYAFDVSGLYNYFRDVERRYYKHCNDRCPSWKGIEWLKEEAMAWMPRVIHEWMQTADPYHMKTELLVCARK